MGATGRDRKKGLLLGLLLLGAAEAWAAPSVQDESAESDPAALAQRQQGVRDRMQRLENRMLELARLLAESEPEKAERLRDALTLSGQKRIRSRLEKLVAMIDSGQLSSADHEQATVLADLNGLLELLTSSLNELDRMRERRERLEAVRRALNELADEQRQNLYRTQHARQEIEREQGEESSASEQPEPLANDEAFAELLERLEQLQRQTQREAGDVQRMMQPESDGEEPAPGLESAERARERMQRAADRLGEQRPGDAEQLQKEALEELQKSIDELEQNLRQIREQEREETLAALEARFQSMLEQEKRVRESVVELVRRGGQQTRRDVLQVTEARELQAQVIEEARTTRRILVDEGTTVVVPELLGQIIEDMDMVVARLAQSDVDALTVTTLDGVIESIAEILGAIAQQRDRDAEGKPQGQQQQSQRDESPRLLRRSAELKLMRSGQVRLNDRSVALTAAEDTEDQAGVIELLRSLSERQLRLADQARRMNERTEP